MPNISICCPPNIYKAFNIFSKMEIKLINIKFNLICPYPTQSIFRVWSSLKFSIICKWHLRYCLRLALNKQQMLASSQPVMKFSNTLSFSLPYFIDNSKKCDKYKCHAILCNICSGLLQWICHNDESQNCNKTSTSGTRRRGILKNNILIFNNHIIIISVLWYIITMTRL